jgi:hypothetical protein
VPDTVPSIAEPPALIAVSAVLPLLWFRWRCCFERDRPLGTHWRARFASPVMMAGQDVVKTFFFDHAPPANLQGMQRRCAVPVGLRAFNEQPPRVPIGPRQLRFDDSGDDRGEVAGLAHVASPAARRSPDR